MQESVYIHEKAKVFWKPVADGILKRMKKRGLDKAMMLGLFADHRPQPEIMELWKDLLPGVPWVSQGHHWATEWLGCPIGYTTGVYTPKWAVDPGIQRFYGWKRPGIPAVYFPRVDGQQPLTFDRLLPEWDIQGKQRGVGRLAADFFPVKTGRRTMEFNRRYVESRWSNLCLRDGYLAPGPEGAVTTVRFEMMREGVQECEARIFIERALTDEALRAKLGEERASRLQAILDERTRRNLWVGGSGTNYPMYHKGSVTVLGVFGLGFHWYAGSGWQGRSKKLFEAAGKVAKVLR